MRTGSDDEDERHHGIDDVSVFRLQRSDRLATRAAYLRHDELDVLALAAGLIVILVDLRDLHSLHLRPNQHFMRGRKLSKMDSCTQSFGQLAMQMQLSPRKML